MAPTGNDRHEGDTSGTGRDRDSLTLGGEFTRRHVLSSIGVAGVSALAGCSLLSSEGDRPAATQVDTGRASDLAVRFAPDLFYGRAERWFPTDPTQYTSEDGTETVVDGFDALDGYAAALDPSTLDSSTLDSSTLDGSETTADGEQSLDLPAPVAYYNVVQYEGTDLGVVQYWLYAAFDQFSVNFHWHDWELLQVFVDLTDDSPVLFAASAHSRRVPNNEFLEPDTVRPAVISEVGSHSSALGVNQTRDQFERLGIGGDPADVTNDVLAVIDLPLAYGLPRDEGWRLPYSLPELDGGPLYRHPELPNVTRDHFVPQSLTVPAFDTLDSPPDDIPKRETGTLLVHEERSDAPADAAGLPTARYALESVDSITHVDDFRGPQLSFAFAVPGFVEDAVASHITSVGVPWEQPRFTDPVADVTDATHRAALTNRFDISATTAAGAVVARLREAAGAADVLGNNGVQTTEATTEGVALLASDPEAVPSFAGRFVVLDPPSGDHQLTVNAPGVAPYVERLTHGGDAGDTAPTPDTTSEGSRTAAESATVTPAGVNGEVVVTPNEAAVKFRADATDADAPTLEQVAVTDDFGGEVYSSRVGAEERPAVYVHRAGAYTADVRDAKGRAGAYRVNPGRGQATATVDRVRTGKGSLASYLETFLRETRLQIRALAEGTPDRIDEVVPADARDPAAGQRGTPADTPTETTTTEGEQSGGPPGPLEVVLDRLTRALRAAQNALSAIENRNETAADNRLEALVNQLDAIRRTVDARSGDIRSAVVTLLTRRLELLETRTERAIESDDL